jgi:hypothetical protein
MSGLPRNKYDLLPYATTLSEASLTRKREWDDSSEVEFPSSPPHKFRARKRRDWRDSSDVGYSSDVTEEEDLRRIFETDQLKEEAAVSSQTSVLELSMIKFRRILNAAIMEGLDSVDFSYVL